MRRRGRRVKNFFKTPKGLLTMILVVLVALGAPHEGIRTVAPGLAGAVFAAALIDLVILRTRKKPGNSPAERS